jgi:hypothetical protein
MNFSVSSGVACDSAVDDARERMDLSESRMRTGPNDKADKNMSFMMTLGLAKIDDRVCGLGPADAEEPDASVCKISPILRKRCDVSTMKTKRNDRKRQDYRRLELSPKLRKEGVCAIRSHTTWKGARETHLAGNSSPRECADESANGTFPKPDTNDTASDVDAAPRDNADQAHDDKADPGRGAIFGGQAIGVGRVGRGAVEGMSRKGEGTRKEDR